MAPFRRKSRTSTKVGAKTPLSSSRTSVLCVLKSDGTRVANSYRVAAPSIISESTVGVAMIAERYELLQMLGRGSMGEVWLARHNTLFENVAIKLLAPEAWGDAGEERGRATAQFHFEARIAAHLARKTRHIVQVTDHGETHGIPYLVMELLEGATLETKLSRGDALSLIEVQELVRQVARALDCAHDEGVLHRDLKPANIFLARDENGQMLAKVLDFGIAQFMKGRASIDSPCTDRELIFGTPGYMSPEQALGHVDLDGRCDLWALATIAFESLTSELPVPGHTASELVDAVRKGRTVALAHYRPDLPESVGAFFERAFAKRADARFATATELTRAFDAAIQTDVPRNLALASSSAPRLAASRRSRRFQPIVTGIVAGVMLATGLLGVTSRWRAGHGFRISLPPLAFAAPESRRMNTSIAPALVPVSSAESTKGTLPMLPVVGSGASVQMAPTEPSPATAPPPASDPPATPRKSVVVRRLRAIRTTTIAPDPSLPLAPASAPAPAPPDPVDVSSPTAGCALPYVTDATGKKHWTLQCL
jgi:serine/threonine protein kinase